MLGNLQVIQRVGQHHTTLDSYLTTLNRFRNLESLSEVLKCLVDPAQPTTRNKGSRKGIMVWSWRMY